MTKKRPIWEGVPELTEHLFPAYEVAKNPKKQQKRGRPKLTNEQLKKMGKRRNKSGVVKPKRSNKKRGRKRLTNKELKARGMHRVKSGQIIPLPKKKRRRK